MLCKIALRNVRRSARDYAIYFVTVTLGVAMFYAFNTINDQAVLLDALSTDSLRMLDLLNMMMGLFSGAVACVLGFLVVYANRFIIRRRKREFGMYLMLGMNPRRVSGILACETTIVGALSLVAGLVLGIGLSQGLSFATAALMGTTMSKYQFVVSVGAIGFTCLCFLIIFVVSALVDIIYIRRCRLAKLLSAHESSESARPIRIPLRVAGFVASIVLLASAYWQLSLNGMVEIDEQFGWACALMIVGTFLFFWSVAGFAIAVLTRAKGAYFKSIRMFTVRQISSKINTAFASMATVSIMLFFALTVTSTGMGLVELFVGNLENTTAYDVTIYASGINSAGDTNPQLFDEYDGDIEACLADRATLVDRSASWNELVKDCAQLDYYRTDTTYASITAQVANASTLVSEDTLKAISATPVQVISESQYNAVCALTGRPRINLGASTCAVNNLPQGYNALAQAFIDSKATLTIAGAELHFDGEVLHTPMRTSAIADAALEIIVPDAVASTLAQSEAPSMSYLDIMYACDRAEGDALLNRMLREAFPTRDESADASANAEEGTNVASAGESSNTSGADDDASANGNSNADSAGEETYSTGAWPLDNVYTGREMADQASGMRMVITYLAVYIGLVLLIATAAILAIQQLSETADSLGRYRRLSTLGCDRRTILRSLKTQTVVYFLAPLALATSHTVCAIAVLSGTLFNELGVDISGSIAFSAGMVCAVYAVYLVVTYLLSRNVIASDLGE